MQCKWLQIFCLCVAIQIQLVLGSSNWAPSAGQTQSQQPRDTYNNANNNGWAPSAGQTQSQQPRDTYNNANNNGWHFPNSDTDVSSRSNVESGTESTRFTNNGEQNVQQQSGNPEAQHHSHGHVQPLAGNPAKQYTSQGSQSTRYICSRFTEYYDCQFKDVHLKNEQSYNFGLENNHQQKLTFLDSTLEYLPKSLVDAFPRATLLNLNGLTINSIERYAFERAANLETLYLENNRLVNIDRGAFSGAHKLHMLVLSKNEITLFDSHTLDSHSGLEFLYLDQNQLTALPAFIYTSNLKYLNASHNNLASIDDRHFRNLRHLQTLDVSFNQLKRLNLQQLNSNLDVIDVSFNGLTELVIPTHVTHLNAKNNSLTEFVVGEQCNIVNLILARNKLETVPELKNCRAMEYLDLSNNLLEVFEFGSSMFNLHYLHLAHNNLFEFHQPIKSSSKPINLMVLDLSHNKLSHGPSLSVFKNLEWVFLNDNYLISLKSYHDSSQGKFKGYRMAINEWSCQEIPRFERWTEDKNKNLCAKEMREQKGICCVDYTKPYNDRLNQILREADFHERANQKNCPKPVATDNNQQSHLEEIRNAISSANTENADKLREIENLGIRANEWQKALENLKKNRDRLNSSKRNLAHEIEKQRQFHRVTKEGLISNQEMLKRIIKFVEEKDAFNKDLQNRRKQDTEESIRLFEEKKQEIDELNTIISNLQSTQAALKQEEKTQKKEKDLLEKKVNKNAASIHGGSGRIS